MFDVPYLQINHSRLFFNADWSWSYIHLAFAVISKSEASPPFRARHPGEREIKNISKKSHTLSVDLGKL
jgi:hypothetical protein